MHVHTHTHVFLSLPFSVYRLANSNFCIAHICMYTSISICIKKSALYIDHNEKINGSLLFAFTNQS